MLRRSAPSRAKVAGLSMIELMIAITLGLIVIGAVVTFAVSTIRSYSDNIRSTRLTQDLRNSMNLIVRELRRAGADSTSVSRVLTDSNPSAFTTMTVTGSCVSYEYDRGIGGAGGPSAAAEKRAIRLNAGAVQISGAGDCAAGGTAWVDVSDPAIVEITKFTPVLLTSRFCADLGSKVDPATGLTVYNKAEGSVKSLSLCVKGRLRADSTVSRHVADISRVRAEDVRFFTGAAAPCSAGVADALPTPAALNNTCAL